MVSSVQKLGVAMDFASGSNSADALDGLLLRLEGERCYGFVLRRNREVRAQDRSLRGESLEVSWVTYKTKRERSHGVVSSSSGRERPR